MPKERTPEMTSHIMATIKNKDGKAERALRSRLFRAGLRYRVHVSALIGRPDIVFTRRKIAVFVDGDFWHGNAWKTRGLASFEEQFHFRSRPEFWERKIRGNMARDERVTTKLTERGWRVIRIWESDILKDVAACARLVEAAVREWDAGDHR